MTAVNVIDFALFRPPDRRILVQRRNFNRKQFPGLWELPGGHLEAGEDVEACIRRELREECGLELGEILGLAHRFVWEDGHTIQEIYAITAIGNPHHEPDKVIEQRWIPEAGIQILLNGIVATNGLYMGASAAFDIYDHTVGAAQ
jgi:8-oxo-dGTP pyrophosphatase MutT (NUDIX family)